MSDSVVEAIRAGQLLQQEGKFSEARKLYESQLPRHPDHPELLHYLGLTWHQLGEPVLAQRFFSVSLKLEPKSVAFLRNYAIFLKQQEKFQEAYKVIEKAISLDGQNSSLYHLSAEICKFLKRPFGVYTKLGMAYYAEQNYEKSLESYKKALELNPKSGEANYNLGTIHYQMMQFDEAERYYLRALEINPKDASSHLNYSLLLLLQGRFDRAWEEYRWRWKSRALIKFRRKYQQPEWKGEPLRGKALFLYAEQGFGDVIHFCRYIPMIEKDGGRVILECHPELVELAQTVEGVDLVQRKGTKPPAFDYQLPLLDLPAVFKTDLETIPAKVPYLKGPSVTAIDLDELSDAKFRVGIVWAGRPAHKKDAFRSMSLELFAPLFECQDVAFFSLQKGERSQDLQKGDYPVIDLHSRIRNFMDSAAVLEQLDLVISVDTAVVHLAGALGRPVWMLDRHFPDWRWLLDREDSPWYPSLRIFRQKEAGDWESVVQRVLKALKKECS